MFLSSPRLPEPPTRIISLVPSITELLWSLNLKNALSGITKFCVHPLELRQQKEIIGGTKNVNVEKIIALRPHLVIANKEENVKEEVDAIAVHCPVWLTDVNNLADAITMINEIGQLTFTLTKAKAISLAIEERFTALLNLKSTITCCYLIWKDPLMTVGGYTFIHDMLRRAGLVNIFGHRERYPSISFEQIRMANPHLLLLSSEPYPFSGKHAKFFLEKLPGVKIMLVDGEMFSWYGSHLLAAPSYFKQLTDVSPNGPIL